VESFRQYIVEEKGQKNLHMTHLEELILLNGVTGGRDSINFLRSVRDMLAGQSKKSVNITVKWDGAPAIFAGIDPEDGKFFVGTKGVFNKTPKYVKSKADLSQYGSGLQDKLSIAFDELKKMNIPKGIVLQGDMLYGPGDLEEKDFDGVSHVTFTPNTITYAIPSNSALAKRVKKSKIGVIFHTTYTGDTLQDMTASFGADVSKLRRTGSVFFDNADYRDVSGTATLTANETTEVTRYLSRAGTVFQKIPGPALRKFLTFQQSLSGSVSGASFATYTNSLIRQGKTITDPRKHTREYREYFKNYWETKVIAKVKSPEKIEEKRRLLKEHLRAIAEIEVTLRSVIEFQINIMAAKNMLVRKLNTAGGMARTFVKVNDGYRATTPEGFVAIDRMSGNAVKLVDRLEFSHLNFTVAKNWDK